MEKCNVCPRNCNVKRDEKIGFCGQSDEILIAKVMIHHFEEPIISGDFDCNSKVNRGSGAIFFCGCNLRCIYCQNYDISHCNITEQNISQKNNIKKTNAMGLAKIFKKLEIAGAYNINLVTPTHFTNQIIQALDIYRPKIPIVWNTSGYEKVETLEKLKNYVDIFLTDFKYFDNKLAKEFSFASDYKEVCSDAVIKCRELQPVDIIKNGIMQKGVIIRHLMLPSCVQNTLDVIDFVYKNLGNDTIFSLMSQYVPFGEAKSVQELNRKIKPLEYKIAVNRLEKLGFKNAYIQDFSSASDIYTPDFETNDDEFFE